MAAKIYHEILRVNEDELRRLVQENPITGFPTYYCVTRNNTVLLWPAFDPEKTILCWTETQ